MASVDILHPLNGDTIAPNFDVLVAYNFGAALTKTDVQITCTVSGAAPQIQTAPAGSSGQRLFVFGGVAVGLHSITVATSPNFGSDTETNITVAAAAPVGIMPLGPPHPLTGLPAAPTDVYTVTGVNSSPPRTDWIHVEAFKLNAGQGNGVGRGDGPKWTAIRPRPMAVRAVGAGAQWTVDVRVPSNNPGRRLMFQAIRTTDEAGNDSVAQSSRGNSTAG